MVQSSDEFLKNQTAALIESVGIREAAQVSYRSERAVRQYLLDIEEGEHRFIPIDAVAAIEARAEHPYVTIALTELYKIFAAESETLENVSEKISHVARLSENFGRLMFEYCSIDQSRSLTPNEIKHLFARIIELQASVADFNKIIVRLSGEY